jgi:hypothetical protein
MSDVSVHSSSVSFLFNLLEARGNNEQHQHVEATFKNVIQFFLGGMDGDAWKV